MNCEKQTVFFLGANTPQGFYSLFEDAYSPYEGWNVTIIKGGPGTGKSSLMKKLAAALEEKGIAVERVTCSSDPDSYDGVIAPELKYCIFDGTSPHACVPET